MIKKYKILLGMLCILELLIYTYAKNAMGVFISPILVFLIGILIGVLPLFLFNKTHDTKSDIPTNKNWQIISLVIIIITGFISTMNLVKAVVRGTPLSSPQMSDIIPLLNKMVVSFMNGEYPYKTFNDFGYDFSPTYLPTHWMPFILAEKLHLDYRIMATIVLFFCLMPLFYSVIKSPLKFIEKLFIIIIPFISIDAIILTDSMSIAVAVEQMIMGYYILLCTLMVNQSNPLMRGGAILLCLLSRFSLLFWLPLYLLNVAIFEGKDNMVKSLILIFTGIIVIYILPFMSIDGSIFLKAQNHYSAATIGEWSRPNAPHIHNGLGLAVYFLYYIGDTIEHKIQLLQLTNFLLCISIIGLFSAFLIRNKQRIDHRIFNIASLKISLTIFYSFIQIPYSYLFLVPLAVSIVVLYAFLKLSV